MQNKQTATELYQYLVQALLKNEDKRLKDRYKKVAEEMQRHYTDVEIATVNTKRPKGVEKLITVLIREIKVGTITYMEAVKSGKYIWIAYRIKREK